VTSADDPEYTTHAVAERTGIPAETFLAWERRHGIPGPHRTANRERLYSLRDIADIIWLRKRTEEGIPIRHAVAKLKATASPDTSGADESPSLMDVVVSMTAAPEIATPLPEMASRAGEQTIATNIVNALIRFDERQASEILAEFAALGTTSFMIATLVPDVLASLAHLANSGRASLAAERLGRLFLARKLGALLETINPPSSKPPVLVAGVSAETHEIDVLLEAIHLAREGHRILFLGTEISLIDLVTIISATDPQQVALVAASASAARMIDMYHEHLRLQFSGDTQPYLLTGGSAFPARSSLRDEPESEESRLQHSPPSPDDHPSSESGSSLTET